MSHWGVVGWRCAEGGDVVMVLVVLVLVVVVVVWCGVVWTWVWRMAGMGVW